MADQLPDEQTGPQFPSIIGGYWGGSGAGSALYASPLDKAQRGSGAFEGQNDYDRPGNFPGGVGTGPLIGGAPPSIAGMVLPLTLPWYRVMAKDPTLKLAQNHLFLSIMAAETDAVVDPKLADDPIAQRGRAILDTEILKRRQKLFRGMLQSEKYGWKDHEVVYERKESADLQPPEFIGVKRFKQLAGDLTKFGLAPGGELVRIINKGKPLEGPYFLHSAANQEDDNHWGESRMEYVRRAWANYNHYEDQYHQLTRKITGTVARVGVPPEDPSRKDKTKFPNMEMALKVGNSVTAGRVTAYYQTAQLDPDDMNDKTAQAKLVDVDILDIGNPGPALSAIEGRLANLDKLKLRGWSVPERAALESQGGASRADSESHGDMTVADAEATHERLVEELNEQTVAALILENCGPEYVGRIRLVAMPLQDDRKQALAAFFDKLLEDPAFRAGIIKAMEANGVEALVQKVGIDIALKAGVFKYEPQVPPAGGQPGGSDGDDDKKDPPARDEDKEDDDADDDDDRDELSTFVVDELAELVGA